jgi:DNA-binding response OmpR family regulator
MTSSAIRVLHIDDDRIQQALVARSLNKLEGYEFSIQTATSEDDALLLFMQRGVDLVILDYHLNKGDGLSCLRRLRQIDPIVPIIAVSGVATADIATKLIEEGADDYLCKQVLNFGQILSQCVRNALTRAKSYRRRFSTARESSSSAAPCGQSSPPSLPGSSNVI